MDQPTVKIDFDNCDSSDSDIPSPRPKTPMQLLREEAEKAMAISTPTHDGRRAGQKASRGLGMTGCLGSLHLVRLRRHVAL